MEPLGDAKAYLDRCKLRKERGDLQGASADCDEALKLDPKLPSALALRASLRLGQRDADGAIADCGEALKSDPLLVEAYQTRALAHQLRGEVKEALADSSLAIEIDPKNALSFMVRSGAWTARGNVAAAMEDFQKAVSLDPSVANPFQNAMIGTETAHSSEEPRDAAGYISRAQKRRAAGSFADAVLDCSQALKLDPQAVEALIVRGMTRRDQGYDERAIADFDRALQIEPRNTRAFTLRGQMRGAQGKLDEARLDYDQAVEADPVNSQAYTYRAQVRAAQGDTEGAVADCNRTLEIDPRNADAYLTRAAARWQMGDLVRALNDTDEAILLEPNDGKAYLLRGNIRQASGDEKGAEEDFQLAVSRDGSLADALARQGYEVETNPSEPLGGPVAEASPEDNSPSPAGDFRPSTTARPGGPRVWIVAGTLNGALAGLLYALIAGTFTGVALAALVFAPFGANLLLGKIVGPRNAIVGGLVAAAGAIALVMLAPIEPPFVDATGEFPGRAADLICWLLAWGIMGAIITIFAGASQESRIIRGFQGGISGALRRARRGAVAGLLLGLILASLYRLVPGSGSGATAGLCAGLILGGASGRRGWALVFGMTGLSLGSYCGGLSVKEVYAVIGAGVSAGIYWSIAGSLVGLFAGGSAGARASEAVAAGPLFGRLLRQSALTEGRGFNLATALLAAVSGLFVGGGVGSIAGILLGGITEAADESALGMYHWLGAGAALGGIYALLFGGRAVIERGERSVTERGAATVPPSSFPSMRIVVMGIAIGSALALAAWLGTDAHPGTVLYWTLAGAGTGGVIGAKLWSVTEKPASVPG